MVDKRIEIMNAARKLFTEKGFKDTNVAQITKEAGVATGTFYNYYTSKDKLFMEIYLEENVTLKKRIMDEVNLNGHPIEVMGRIMHLNTIGMQTHPILKEWYNREVFDRIEKAYREENGIAEVSFMYDVFIDIVIKWQTEGKIRKDIDAEMIMAIFSSIINVDTHKDEIGLQYFPKLMDYLGEFVMKGLLIS